MFHGLQRRLASSKSSSDELMWDCEAECLGGLLLVPEGCQLNARGDHLWFWLLPASSALHSSKLRPELGALLFIACV